MPFYEFECVHGYHTDQFYPMGESPQAIPLAHSETLCTFNRVYSFRHVEDRRHMRRGISAATGEPVAQSRSEERLIEKTKGIEFVGRSEMPSQWKKLGDYAKHVNAGGDRVDSHAVNAEPLTSTKGDLLRKMEERGVRFNT